MLQPGRDADTAVYEALGRLYLAGLAIDFARVPPGRPVPPLPLPTYPFERERHWIPTDTRRLSRAAGRHPLLGERFESPELASTVFDNRIAADDPDWIGEHRVFGRPVLPATAYFELARAAGAATGAGEILHDATLLEVMPVESERQVQTLVVGDSVRIVSRPGDGGAWHTHFSARLGTGPATPSPLNAPGVHGESVDTEQLLARIRARGVEHSGAFRALQSIRREGNRAQGELDTACIEDPLDAAYAVHPALLDAAFQLCGACFDDADETIYLPAGVERYEVYRPGPFAGKVIAIAELSSAHDDGTRVCRVDLVDAERCPIASVTGLRFRPAAAAAATPVVDDCYYGLEWIDVESLQSVPAGDLRLALIGDGADADALARCLSGSVASVERCTPAALSESLQATPEPFDLVVLVPPQGIAPDAMPEAWQSALRAELEPCLAVVQTLAASNVSAPLCTVTRAACVVEADDEVDPAAAAVWGLLQSVAAEVPGLLCRRIDLPPGTCGDVPDALARVITGGCPEDRLAWRGGLKAARLARLRLPAADPGARPEPAYRLEIGQPGDLDRLALVADSPAAPGDGEIRIRVEATGLNFRDVLNVLGMYPGDAGPLGSECVGTVKSIGPNVEGFAIGDRIMAITPRGFCSLVNVAAVMAVPVPDGMTIGAAATVPIAFLTADWALNVLGRLTASDRVLIHAGAGGVGMAAIQLARLAGAEVFATAGSPRKRTLLRRLGVEHVYDSRSLAFREQLLADTSGQGVDVILNSLADDFIGASFDVLAQGGRFLEIGKSGVWDADKVRELRPDADYHVIYLGEACVGEPARVRARFLEIAAAFEAGQLRPLPYRGFLVDAAGEAFRFMAQARHTGKIVLFDSRATLEMPVPGAIWITGGLGGLGLALAGDLAAHGYRRIVLSGRSGPDDQAEQGIAALRAAGAEVLVLACDVTDQQSVRDARLAIEAAGWTIRHLVHAAGVLADAALARQSWTNFERVLAVKAIGALNLQRVTADLELASFVLFSAGAALLGSPGQANYAAANAFLDGLAAWRRRQGLPATSIAWGPWAEVGMAAKAGLDWTARGLASIEPARGTEAYRRLLHAECVYSAVLPIDWERFPVAAGAGATAPFFEFVTQGIAAPEAHAAGETWRQQLAALAAAERVGAAEALVGGVVAAVLGLDPDRPLSRRKGLSDLGIDSLMAVELARRLSHNTGLDLPSTLAFEHPTLESLVNHLLEEFAIDSPATNADTPAAARTAAAADIDELSADEASSALLDELDRIGY
jgi:NADPH:quinone reductase-like Zn-dependent oxidoreductase/NAD(P)-dependent dehydrogenase (short-subunit alcohol dehydrogenase family)/acyl carrier protein